MRRLLCMVLTGAVMIGCLCTGTGAVDESNVVSYSFETTGTAITRATGNLDWTIEANGTVVADTSFTMSAGETVWIRANYSPENASLDFGLVDSNEKFHYINVTTGSIDKTIEIPENGDYTLAIRNNSSKSVNGDHFVSDTLNKTEIVGAARALAYQLDDGNYPVSDKGKTYGSALLSEIVGHEPDLISAVGTDGQAGYVKYEDVKKPEIKNPSEAVSYMQDRLETYTVPLYDLQEEVIGEFEIGCAMDVTGYSLEEAKEMVNLGERAGSVLSVEQTSLINGNFPKNVRGETYGTALMAEVVGEMPDLQAAIGTNDQEGYVRTSDLSHPKFETPQDALEWQKTQPDSYYIPLYDFQGNEIGSFLRERNNLTIAEMEAMKG